ncbi:MAG: class I SAM-dependent methyltransferase [Proteobacteria bacterium]|nr:class I SAM-dependent methyltransferase [Pseudomonadota bacterium]
MRRCRVCGSAIEPFMSFGPMPLANGFLRAEEFASEAFFDLEVAFCERCAMVQLTEPVPPELMFHEQYPFYTSGSTLMTAHFHRLAAEVAQSLAREPDAFVVEIGSNDGTLLQAFSSGGTRHLGVDPSRNVAEAARAKGVETLCRFFDEQAAREIVLEYGQADAIIACNCFCHVGDLHALAAGIRALLKPGGLLVFEDPYLGDIVRLTSYDQIYDEHAYYFSAGSVSAWLSPYGLEVIDAQPQAVHGGSMRYTVARKGVHPARAGVAALRAEESRMALQAPHTYSLFRRRIEQSREALRDLLTRLHQQGKRVAGYGATSKSTTILNYCGITPELIEYITDTTPLKQGKFSPGAHIPVRSPAAFHFDFPDCALLFAWNHAEEIGAKETAFRSAGGKWIRYVPRVTIE